MQITWKKSTFVNIADTKLLSSIRNNLTTNKHTKQKKKPIQLRSHVICSNKTIRKKTTCTNENHSEHRAKEQTKKRKKKRWTKHSTNMGKWVFEFRAFFSEQPQEIFDMWCKWAMAGVRKKHTHALNWGASIQSRCAEHRINSFIPSYYKLRTTINQSMKKGFEKNKLEWKKATTTTMKWEIIKSRRCPLLVTVIKFLLSLIHKIRHLCVHN